MDELLQAQEELARTLGQARIGEARDVAGGVRERGEQVAQLLAGLLKLARVHAPENRAFDGPAAEFARVLTALLELLGNAHLVAVEDQVYVNEVRLRTEGKAILKGLGAELAKHDVGGLTFHAPLDAAAVRALVRALLGTPPAEEKRAALAERLRQGQVTSVELAGPFRFRFEKGEAPGPATSAETVPRVLDLVAQSMVELEGGRSPNPLPLRRSVLDLLDAGLGAPAFWGGLPAEASPHAVHAYDVALLALLVGKAAGFSPGFLQDLGVAALLHDTGYLGKGMGGGPEGFARHPLEGARLMLRQRGFSEAKVRRLRAILEHHRDLATPGARPSAAGAILRLAEDYANLCRLFGAQVLRADALGGMLRAGGTYYHPVLAQVLVNALGRHPPGTVLELEDGRWARVAAPARSPALWALPLVRLVDSATGQLLPETVDLARGPRIHRAVPG